MAVKKLHNPIYLALILAAILLGAFPADAARVRPTKKITVEKPDFDKIARQTLDPRNEFYFPKLMKLYNRNDTSMTQEQYRNLYLGYLFQEDYDPYRTSPYNAVSDSILQIVNEQKARLTTVTDSLNKLVKANKISGHEAEKKKERISNTYKRTLRELATAVELSLKDNPFDLRQMSVLVHASQEMGNAMKAKIWEYRLENILGAIKSTGSGDSMENAFYVIYPMHEYNIIQLLGYEPVSVDFPSDGFDYISVQPDADAKRKPARPVSGFYFNVGPLTEQYDLKHPEAGDSDPNSSGSTQHKITPDADDFPAADDDFTTILSPDETPAE
ncbi:MAG: DUF4919 domain-containing protein [Muribaculaceae bacterium]|nr:DUF4919 domain-containing protein [Muribaculaceae bacterium]